jgi:hypothetical protein
MDTKTVNIHPLERSLSALLGVMLLIRSLTHRWYCQHGLYSLCDSTNPNAELQEPLLTCSGVVFPDRFSPVFTLRADCTLLTLKQAKQSRLFFQVFW